MKACLILADAAHSDPMGKVHALGLGWTVIGSPSPPIALIAVIDCPWDQTNTQHSLKIELVDADGHPVSFESDPFGNPAPFVIDAGFEVGRPPGHPHGTAIRQHLTLNLAPGMPLVPGQRYEFRLSVNGEVFDGWLATLFVRSQEAPPAFPA